MPRQLWIADVARAEGLTVVEVDGWRDRGRVEFNPGGVVAHHTGGSPKGDMGSLNVLINGRAGLPGPLCNWGLARSGTVYVVAAGRANHAGKGGWRGMVGNSSVLGIEAEHTGSATEKWPQVQLDAYYALHAAAHKRLHRSVDFTCGHKEWAPTRKIDPRSLNMDTFRTLVAKAIREGRRSLTPDEKRKLDEAFDHSHIKVKVVATGNKETIGVDTYVDDLERSLKSTSYKRKYTR